MTRIAFLLLVGLIGVFLGTEKDNSADADKPVVFRGARLLTAAGDPIDNGVLVIHKGKIVVAGPAEKVEIPRDAEVHDAKGKVIIPGLVDTHSHVGIWPKPHVPAHNDGNEGSGPVQTGLRAMDSISPSDPGIRMAVAGGVTTANIMPGSGNVIGGQTLYVKLRGRTVEDMRVESKVLGGLKMANGENPKRFNFERGKFAPATRMKLAALQREQFIKAREYQKKWAAYHKAKKEGKETAEPERDIAMEPLVEVLERRRTVHFHTHRADDLMTAVRIAREFDFDIVLQHATEGYRVADELARLKIPVSLTLVDSPGGKLEVSGLIEENAAILDRANVKVAINTDDSVTESRFFLRTGAIAVRGGMSEDAALRALTIHGAQMLQLDHRLGSLEAGKDADFVVLSGAPFSVYTQVLETWIDGVRVFNRVNERDRPYQTGGFALADHDLLPRLTGEAVPQREVAVPSRPKEAPLLKGQPKKLVIFAGMVHTVSGETIRDGAVLIEDGVIKQVGSRDKFHLPLDVPVLTARHVTPGLIDAHTSMGVSGALNVSADQDQDEATDPNQADLRVLDGFHPAEPMLEFLRSQGVTVIQAMPGPSNVLAGQAGIFRTHGVTAERMALRTVSGLLINLGERPKSTYPNRLPTTRMGTAALVRQAFTQAQSYARQKAGKDEKKPPHNAKHEALALALERKVPVLFAAHRADDIQTALRLAREFNLDARIHMATEGYLMADELKKAGVPVVVHPTMQRPGSMETYHSYLGNAAALAARKIPLALGTGFEGYVPRTRVARQEAAMAMVNGLGFDGALRAITLDAAKELKLDDRLGSIEVGKVADLVLYDGDPFEHATHVTCTLMAGKVVYDREEYLKLPFARRALPMLGGGGVGCCLGQW
jgi:imidazolonepropionase-like amidohydrolase